MARVVSETDLQRIDKRATFATHAMVQPAELLARLVNILGYIPPPPDDDEPEPVEKSCTGGGVQLFSEKEILRDEVGPWSPQVVRYVCFKWLLCEYGKTRVLENLRKLVFYCYKAGYFTKNV